MAYCLICGPLLVLLIPAPLAAAATASAANTAAGRLRDPRQEGKADAVKALVEEGADTEAKNKISWTALLVAAASEKANRRGSENAVLKALLEKAKTPK